MELRRAFINGKRSWWSGSIVRHPDPERGDQYERCPNDALLVTLSGSAAEFGVSTADWNLAQLYSFVSGERSMDEWDQYTKEWLNKGGKEVIQQYAEQLGVDVPDYAK